MLVWSSTYLGTLWCGNLLASCRVVPKMFLSAKEKESQHLRLFLTFSRYTYSNFEKTFVKVY